MRRALLLISLLVPTAVSHADGTLHGQNPIEFVIEKLDPDAEKCGVTQGDLEAAVEFPLLRSQLRIKRGVKAWLYHNVNIIYLKEVQYCMYSESLEFYIPAVDDLNNLSFSAITWNQHGMGLSRRQNAKGAIRDQVEDLTKKFVIQWTRFNQK